MRTFIRSALTAKSSNFRLVKSLISSTYLVKFAFQLTCAVLYLISASAHAQDETFDPRSLAMGGAGVATADMSNAAFHNPAMLASSAPSQHIALEFPIYAMRVIDPYDLQNDTGKLSINANNFTLAMNNFDASKTIANAHAASVALSEFNRSLVTINHKTMTGNGLIGTMLALPNSYFAVSLYVDARADIAGQFNYAPNDQITLNNLAKNLAACNATPTGYAACMAAVAATPGGKITGLQSQLLVRGIFAKDLGIAAAHHFEDVLGLDVGVVPKITQFSSYDYTARAQSNSKISLSHGKQDFSMVNFDFGVAKSFHVDTSDIKVGLAMKNLLPQHFTTVLHNRIDISPQATLGASLVTNLTTTGIDLDVIPNKAMLVGLSKDSQYLRVGTEFDAWRWAQIRIGYRHDLKRNFPNLPSIGLGFSPFGLHFDFSLAAANKSEIAVSLQTGAHF
jgi:hypothetical protein